MLSGQLVLPAVARDKTAASNSKEVNTIFEVSTRAASYVQIKEMAVACKYVNCYCDGKQA